MKFAETAIPGAWVIGMEKREDERGYFARVWCDDEFRAHGLNPTHVQVNTQFSPRAGTLRGMHFQLAPHAEVKVVRCLRGAAFDVLVDLRPGSPTFRQWFGIELTPESGDMLYVPEGCAHGYLTLAEDTEVIYFTSHAYAPKSATGVRFDDPAFAIQWPRSADVVSQADRAWPDYNPPREKNA